MPMPNVYYYRGHRYETLAGVIQDLADQFARVAKALADQYTILNGVSGGLLSGTSAWQGKGAQKFLQTWQSFGKYIQQLEKSSQDTSLSLNKLSGKISDMENQEGWNTLLMIAGGIGTLVSCAAMIGELGLNPLIDGLSASLSTFTEKEGANVSEVAEQITEDNTQAAGELQQIEADLSPSPKILDIGSSRGISSLLDFPHFETDTLYLIPEEWKAWVSKYTFEYTPAGSLDSLDDYTPNSCTLLATKMLLTDEGITRFSDEQIATNIQFDPATSTSTNNVATGLRSMGLTEATYVRDDDLAALQSQTDAGKPTPVVIRVSMSMGDNDWIETHMLLVDGFEDTNLGKMVLIRDPYFSPPRAYMMPIWAFRQLWQSGWIRY